MERETLLFCVARGLFPKIPTLNTRLISPFQFELGSANRSARVTNRILNSAKMPVFLKAKRLLAGADVRAAMRNRYAGTSHDAYMLVRNDKSRRHAHVLMCVLRQTYCYRSNFDGKHHAMGNTNTIRDPPALQDQVLASVAGGSQEQQFLPCGSAGYSPRPCATASFASWGKA